MGLTGHGALRLLRAALAGVVLGAAPAGWVVRAAEPEPAQREIVLLGIEDHRLTRIANELRDSGVGETAVGAAAVTDKTDLVLFTVITADGPQPRFLEALSALDGKVVARAAVLLVTLPYHPVDDPEILELVRLETMEALQRYQITDLRPSDVVSYPDSEFAAEVEALLAQSRHDHTVRKPSVPSEPAQSPEVAVPSLRGVPLDLAKSVLESDGLVPVVLPDPDLGLVNACDPEVLDQVPDNGSVVPRGTSVGLLVPHPDTAVPELAGCALPQLTREEVDARVAELRRQPGVS